MPEPLPNPLRFELARRRRGLSMTKLAASVGVDVRSISAFEKGEFTPSPETLATIARQLGFPEAFFFARDAELPPTRGTSFRALSRMKASERDAALGAAALGMILSDWIDAKFTLPQCLLPDLQGDDPEAAAESVRHMWNLGDLPIRNVVHLLESRGVRVFSLAEDTRAVDAFSFWRGSQAFIFLNTAKSAERSRFDAAHELGHLVLHKHGGPVGQNAEPQADAFASAFLMPRTSVLSTIHRTSPGVTDLIRLKRVWTVSLFALMHRARKLNLLSEWQYRSMCIDAGDYRSQEPEPAERETSQVLAKVFAAMKKDGIAKADVARELSIDLPDLEGLIFGLIVADIQRRASSKARPQLRFVK